MKEVCAGKGQHFARYAGAWAAPRSGEPPKVPAYTWRSHGKQPPVSNRGAQIHLETGNKVLETFEKHRILQNNSNVQ